MRKTSRALAVIFAVIMMLGCMSAVSYAASKNPAATKKISSSVTATTIKLTWSKVSGANGYRVYQSVNGSWKTLKSSTTSNTYTVKNLKPATSYKFAIKTYKKVSGKTYWSDAKKVTVKTKAISNTSSLKATAAENCKVNLKWSKVSGATGYIVYVYKGGEWIKLKTTTATSYTASGLDQKTTYKFKVVTYQKISGKNYYSSGKSVSVKTGALSVGSVTAVTATSAENSVTMKWSGSGNITGYRVYIYDAATKKYTKLTTTKNTSYTATGLASSTSYTFTVRPYAKSGSTTVWGKNYKVVKTTALAAPYAMNAIITDGIATITWTRVTGAACYRVYIYDEEAKAYYIAVKATPETTYTLEMEDNTMTKVAVKAYANNDDGGYSWSKTKSFTVGGIAKYRAIFASGEYSYKSEFDGESTEIYVKNGNAQMRAFMDMGDGMTADSQIIYNKEKDEAIALMDTSMFGKFYTTNLEALAGGEVDMSEVTDYGGRFYKDTIASAVTVSEVTYDGAVCVRESYVNEKGETVTFYFKDGELIRHDIVNTMGQVDSALISNVKGTVSDSNFETSEAYYILKGYINIDIFLQSMT